MSVTTEGATRRVTMSQVYVTGLACAMASVRQMSQVWHVMRQMSQVWHVSWRLCVRCHGVRASDVMSRNVKTAAGGAAACCRAEAAVLRSFRVYFCCAAYAELKSQCIVLEQN